MRTQPQLTEPAQYSGQSTVTIAPTQSATSTPREQAKVVDAWLDFFATGPTDIYDLTIYTRVPKRLFDALGSQSQLRRLATRWGVFDDLTPLTAMPHLEALDLGSMTSVKSLEPLRSIAGLRSLAFHNANHITDYTPIGDLVGLKQLMAHGAPSESIAFLTRLTALLRLDWDVVPADLDYSPLLQLQWVKSMRVSQRRGMTPSLADLEMHLPGLQERLLERLDEHSYAWEFGERVGEYRRADDGEVYLYRLDGTASGFA